MLRAGEFDVGGWWKKGGRQRLEIAGVHTPLSRG